MDSARLLWPCAGSWDCSYNGRCTDDGACSCGVGWTGPRCEQLNLQPVSRSALGYRASDSRGNNVSSWGAPVLWDATSQQWHGWASELLHGCGINAWETNSQIVHIVADSPLGPFARREVVWPAFAHEPDVVRAPNGDWVMMFSAFPYNATGLARVLCKNCTDGTTPPPGTPGCPFQRGTPKDLGHKMQQMLAVAPSPTGPWKAVEVPQLTASWDWNTALTINEDK